MSAVQNAPAPLTVLQQIHPDLLRLAQIVSLAARVEPQLVRLARLALLPWAEAGLEADLWFSSLVQARSTLALVLQPELLPDLRRGLANDQELLRRAWSAVLTQIHSAQPEGVTPPLILLEEELVYRGLLKNDPTAAPRIAELLKQAMKTMQRDKERGPALARWALSTYQRLPVQVQQSQDAPNFQALAAYVAGRLGSSILQGVDSSGAGQITISITDPVNIWVRVLETGLELSRTQSDGGNPIPTQRFDTIWVEIRWGEGPDAQAQTVVVPPSGSVHVAASSDVFRVRTVAGDVYTLRALGSPVTRAPPAILHALLIGIDGYPSHFPALQGCVNDVAAIADVLSDPAGIGLPPEQVRITSLVTPAASLPPFLNQAAPATRANLLAALQELGGPEVRAGDRIFIYFAGYGTQIAQGGNAQDALVTSDGQLVCAAELAELLVAIATHTDDVTVILDCGFSDGTREAPIADDRLRSRSLARAVARGLSLPPSFPTGSGRILQGAVTGRVILLAAQPHEPAYEIVVDGKPNGVLTAALTSVLGAVDPAQRPALRWADIVPDLLNRVTTQVLAQRPLLAGYQERQVFGGPWTRRDPGFAVRRNTDGGFQIAAGSLMGVTEGAIIAVYGPNPAVFPPLGSPDDRAVRVSELRVITADRATAVAQPLSSGSPLALPAGARGRLAQPGASERLRVHVNPPDPALAEMLERSPALHVTSALSEAEVTVQGSSEQGWTISNEIEPVVARVSPDQRYVLPTALEAYALYNTVLRLASASNDPVLAGALNVTLLDATDSNAQKGIAGDSLQTTRVQSPPLPEAPRNERGMYRLSPRFPFCLHVSNMSADVLFFTVLNCTSGGRVEYLGDGTVAPGGSVLVWANNRTRQPFVASLAQARNRQIDRVVLVATTEEAIDLRFLAVERRVQEVIDEVSGTRGTVAQVAVPQAGVRTAGLWTAVTVPWLVEETGTVMLKIRLDVAAPHSVFKDEPFDLAVAVLRPDAPPLAIDDLPVISSEVGTVERSGVEEVVRYRIEVTGADCDVKPPSYTIVLRPGEDSKPVYSQVTPHKRGKCALVVNAYQEDDVLVAQTRVRIEVQAPVRSKPNVPPEEQTQNHDKPVLDIVLSPAEVRQFAEALRSAFSRSGLEQVVFFGLEVNLDQIVARSNYDKEVADLAIWVNEHNKVAALLQEARQENTVNVKLREFDAYLQAKQPGSDSAASADAFERMKPDLLNALLKLPVTETAQGRTSLLNGIPGADMLNRNAASRRIDLSLIITQLAKRGRLANGQLPLVKFIENALPYAAGYKVEAKLQAIQQSLKALDTPESSAEEKTRSDDATPKGVVQPGAPPMEFIDIQRHLVDTLLKIPAMADSNIRTKLLDGLQEPKLVRYYNIAQLDLNSMIGGLQNMGPLTKPGGTAPVIVLVDNALQYVPEGSELADELHAIKLDLEAYYGGEVQPAPSSVPAEILEALILNPQRDTQLSSAFLAKAQLAARSVARLAVDRIFNGVPDSQTVYGTSWIIAPGIIITSRHVIDARDPREEDAESADLEAQAAGIVARFDYNADGEGTPYLECRGGKLMAQSRELDYAVVSLNEADKIADRAPLRVVPVQSMLVRGSRMNILQHPLGGPLRIAIRNNFFVGPGRTPALLWYQTDTEPGASGSPVCNDDWEVVALHHASVPVDPMRVPQEVISGQPAQVKILNEGIKIREILNSLPDDVKKRIEAAQAG